MTKNGRAIMIRRSAKGPDFFATPPWATDILLRHETFEGGIWEPACGDGAMAKVLSQQFENVHATDLIDRGYGLSGIDFLQCDRMIGGRNIITNPPYSIANKFVLHALSLQADKTAFLLRTLFLESKARMNKIYRVCPPSKVVVITDRVNFADHSKPGGAFALSWFIWEKGFSGTTQLVWDQFQKE